MKRLAISAVAATGMLLGTLGCDPMDFERDIQLEQSAGHRLPFG